MGSFATLPETHAIEQQLPGQPLQQGAGSFKGAASPSSSPTRRDTSQHQAANVSPTHSSASCLSTTDLLTIGDFES